MSKQQGFTLIELVTVIIILGILAAFAVPRFINVTGAARAAAIEGIGGSVKAATALAHAAYIVKGVTTSPSTISMDGQEVNLVNGYPAASTTGIAAALQGIDSFNHVGGANYTFWLEGDGATAPDDCKVVYEAAPANGSPTVTVTSGCGV